MTCSTCGVQSIASFSPGAKRPCRNGGKSLGRTLLGLVRDATGSESEARDYYRKALYLDPDHGDAQIHLAFLMEKQGDRAAAQVLRSRAQRLEHKSKNRA